MDSPPVPFHGIDGTASGTLNLQPWFESDPWKHCTRAFWLLKDDIMQHIMSVWGQSGGRAVEAARRPGHCMNLCATPEFDHSQKPNGIHDYNANC